MRYLGFLAAVVFVGFFSWFLCSPFLLPLYIHFGFIGDILTTVAIGIPILVIAFRFVQGEYKE